MTCWAWPSEQLSKLSQSEVSRENTLFQAQKNGKTGSLQKPTNLFEDNLTGLSLEQLFKLLQSQFSCESM
jgi:hypothetical protein